MANLVFDFLHSYETGERRESEPANAYQYDEGHVLEAVLPAVVTAVELHYWIRGMEEAEAYTPTSITPNADGSCTILGNIPNKYFETNGELRVYIVVTDGDASITTYEGFTHIRQRSMPDDYVDEDPDNPATRILTEAREAATTATQQAQAASNSAGQAAQSAETLSESVEQITTNKNDISSLKEELPDTYVALAGENQVAPQNIAGMQFTKTEGTVDGENIFSADMLFRNGQYVISSDGVVSIGSNASFNAYCVPVEQNSTYVFPECRFVVLATGNTVNSPTIGDTIQYAAQVNTGEATYLFLSYADKPVGEITVKKREHSIVYSDFILPDWLVDNLPIPTVVEKTKFATVTGDIASGGDLQLKAARTNLRKGERIVFEGIISSFDSLRIGLSFSTAVGTESNQMNTFLIDGTNISYYAQSTSTPVTVAHGLTIANNIQIILELSAEASVKFTLISNGNMFTHVFTSYVRQTIGNPFVLSVGSVLSDCKLTWTCNDIGKEIWMFGDSYFAYDAARWTYYLHQYGYDQNCLLDGFPGEGGVNGRVSFNNLLQYGTPKIAVWCLGMNDGTDSESAPASDWVSARDYFLMYCTDNNITPVFGTIPTVPTINHEQKNAWIKSSGYRYIDFAKAVGASASGAWYGNMLSSDRVHPTETGARALFAQVLLDLPEIMIGGYGTPTID